MAQSTSPSTFQYCYFTFGYDRSTGFKVNRGVSRIDGSVIVEIGNAGMVVANVEKKELLKLEGVDLKDVQHNQIVDLSVDGDRWEGDSLNGMPCGWGRLFNQEGYLVYEGFRMNDTSVCYGCFYYPDIQTIDYEGDLCSGMRWGRGSQYDRKGQLLNSGGWLRNARDKESLCFITSTGGQLHNCIERLDVQDNCCNGEEWKSLDMHYMPRLREVWIGSNCFGNTKELKLIGVNELEILQIDNGCFKQVSELEIIGLRGLKRMTIGETCFIRNEGENTHCCFRLKNCPSLQELKIGRDSFPRCSLCAIESVGGLRVIEMGSNTFQYASLELAGGG